MCGQGFKLRVYGCRAWSFKLRALGFWVSGSSEDEWPPSAEIIEPSATLNGGKSGLKFTVQSFGVQAKIQGFGLGPKFLLCHVCGCASRRGLPHGVPLDGGLHFPWHP